VSHFRSLVLHCDLPSCIRILVCPTFHPHVPTHYLSLVLGSSLFALVPLRSISEALSAFSPEPYFLLALILSFVIIDREDTATTMKSVIPSGLRPPFAFAFALYGAERGTVFGGDDKGEMMATMVFMLVARGSFSGTRDRMILTAEPAGVKPKSRHACEQLGSSRRWIYDDTGTMGCNVYELYPDIVCEPTIPAHPCEAVFWARLCLSAPVIF
jgi:hypothetical protein